MAKEFVKLIDFSAGLVQRGFNVLNWPANALADGLNVRAGANGVESGLAEEEVYDFGAGASVRCIWNAYFALDDREYLVVAVDVAGTTRIYASLSFDVSDPEFTLIHDYREMAGNLTAACVNDRLIINDGLRSGPLVFSGGLRADGSDWSAPRQALNTDDGVNYYGVGDYLADNDPGTFVSLSDWSAAGGLLVCDERTGLMGLLVEITGGANPGAVVTVEYWTGAAWVSVSGLSDGTNGLNQSGLITFDVVTAVGYGEAGGLAGYWYRLSLDGYTGSSLQITRLRLRTRVTPLCNIGSGIEDLALGFIYYDASANSWKDFSLEVADSTQVTFARLNDGAAEDPVGMGPGDYIYIGGVYKFIRARIEPERNHGNANASVMSAEFWNGTSWVSVGGWYDGTSSSGNTLNQSGDLRFTTSGWKTRKITGHVAEAYWIRLTVSASLTATTYICETRVLSQPPELGLYRLVSPLRDRLALIGRSDAADQIDISREGEEYGFTGDDSCSVRIGGQGPITAAVEAFNQLWVCKGSEWYMLNGYNPATFAIERAETSGQSSAGHNAIVSAPIKLSDGLNRHGLYFVNGAGCWNFTGLQISSITDFVSWFGDGIAVDDGIWGMFNARKYEIWWVVSFNGSGRIIVYDLLRQTWNPPFETDVSCLGITRSDGLTVAIGGTTDGRLVTIDEGTDSTRTQTWETGWFNFKSIEIEKRLIGIRVIGSWEGDLVVREFRDGRSDWDETILTTDASGLDFGFARSNESREFYLLKLGFEWTGDGQINGVILELAMERANQMEKSFTDE